MPPLHGGGRRFESGRRYHIRAWSSEAERLGANQKAEISKFSTRSIFAAIAHLVEHFLGKEEVPSSILGGSSIVRRSSMVRSREFRFDSGNGSGHSRMSTASHQRSKVF